MLLEITMLVHCRLYNIGTYLNSIVSIARIWVDETLDFIFLLNTDYLAIRPMYGCVKYGSINLSVWVILWFSFVLLVVW